jgi:tRNA pseudouridine38-40 synthase
MPAEPSGQEVALCATMPTAYGGDAPPEPPYTGGLRNKPERLFLVFSRPMRNVRAQISYDGSLFYGWQRQEGFVSVQGAIEAALLSLLGQFSTVHGSGRTDTGVHGLRQVANFHVETRLEDDRLRHALNAHLTKGVVIRELETCHDDFHSRFDAVGKRYLYLTLTSRFRPPIGAQHAHWISAGLDLEKMRDAARRLIGTHDFRAFGNTGSERKTTVRTVSSLRLIARRDRFAFVIEGSGFLYNMVRTIAGTLIYVGRGKLEPSAIDEALQSGERTAAGPTAPARGLYLVRVLYDEPVFLGGERGPNGPPGVTRFSS